jgi:hypothetical protein
MRRLQHLRIAAENLRAAGMPELAQQVAAEIERLQRDAGPPGERPREVPDGERRFDREPRDREEGRRPDRAERREGEREKPKPQDPAPERDQ